MTLCHKFWSVVFLCGAFLGARERASALTEYCPATIAASHQFALPNESLVEYSLYAFSQRTVSGDVILKTIRGAWYSARFEHVAMTVDAATLRNDYVTFERDLYFSPALYIQLPKGAGTVEALWVQNAKASGDTVHGWDAKGSVGCAPSSSAIDREAGDLPSGFTAGDAVRVDRTAGTWQLPSPAAALAKALPAEAPGSTACSTPFRSARVPKAKEPEWPEDVVVSRQVHAVAQVAVTERGEIADTWIWETSGNDEIDGATMDAARASSYAPAIAFCKPVAAIYDFRAEFVPEPVQHP